MSLVNTNLNEIDFSELYIKQMKVSTFKNKSSEDWNKKAKNTDNFIGHLIRLAFFNVILTANCISTREI